MPRQKGSKTRPKEPRPEPRIRTKGIQSWIEAVHPVHRPQKTKLKDLYPEDEEEGEGGEDDWDQDEVQYENDDEDDEDEDGDALCSIASDSQTSPLDIPSRGPLKTSLTETYYS